MTLFGDESSLNPKYVRAVLEQLEKETAAWARPRSPNPKGNSGSDEELD